MGTGRKKKAREREKKTRTGPAPRSNRVRMAVDGDVRRVVIGPARRQGDIIFTLLAVPSVASVAIWLAWRTPQLLQHRATAGVIATLVGLAIGTVLMSFVVTVQIGWRLFGREEIALTDDGYVRIEARMLGGRISSRVPADRRTESRIEELPNRAKRYFDTSYKLVVANGGDGVGTLSQLTREEGDAALALVRRLLPS